MFRTIKSRRVAVLASLAALALILGPRHVWAYEGGILKAHNHTSVAGDGGQLSNLQVTGFVKISTTGGVGYVFQDGSTQTTAGVAASVGLTSGSSPTITGAWTFGGVSSATFSLAPQVSTGAIFGLMGDPAVAANGQLWYNNTVNRFKYNANGTTVEIDPSFYVVSLLANPQGGTSVAQFYVADISCVQPSTGTFSGCASLVENAVTGALGIATLVRFSCSYYSNIGVGTALTLTIDKNEAATTMTCTTGTPSAGTSTTCATNTNQVSLASGDRISLKQTQGASNTNASDIMKCSFVYAMSTQ